jgi:hypothetical protein
MLRRSAWALLGLLAAFGALLGYWLVRPNRAEVDARLGLEHWPVVADGEHDSNTDLLWWRGAFWLVHAASPYHMGTPRSRLVLRRCDDAAPGPRSVFEPVAELRLEGKDVRDPKLAAIGDRLFLYALANEGFYAIPSGTVVATSEDGGRWSPLQPVGPPGWLFWRPKPLPGSGGRTWYVSAYWKDHGESIVLRSEDGLAWERVGTIHRGEGNDETEIEFVPAPLGGGAPHLLATARLEVTPDRFLGNPDASTLLAFADAPYAEWSDARKRRDRTTRLDGPVLFSDRGRVFAVARYQPGPHGWLTQPGGLWSRKRTSIYLVDVADEGRARLVRLSDLPSAGDTAYAGAVLRDGFLWVDWYTSRIDRDYPWVLGMLLRTDVRMARIPLDSLHRLADARLAESSGSAR